MTWTNTKPTAGDSSTTPHELDTKIVNVGTDLYDKAAEKDYVDTQITTAKSRANHTGTQSASTISDFTSAVSNNSTVAGAVQKTLVDAKGDLLVATADGVVTRLAVGSNDQVLTAASAEGSGVKWATVVSGGGAIDYTSPVSVTAATTLTSTAIGKHHICTGTTANYTVDLPATGLTAGDLISFEMSSALTKLVTLDAGSGKEIDGQQIRILWAREVALLKWDGSDWTKVAGKSVPMIAIAYTVADQNFAAGSTPHYMPMDGAQIQCVGMVDTATGYITFKRPGKYTVAATMLFTNNNSSATYIRLGVPGTLNGVADVLYIDAYYPYQAGTLNQILHSKFFEVIAGDKFTMLASYAAGSFGDITVYGAYTYNHMRAIEIPTW